MDNLDYNERNQNIIEKTVMYIYNIYNVGMTLIAMKNGWNIVVISMMIISMCLIWFFYIIKYRDYRFRAYFTSIMIQGFMVIYGMHLDDLFAVIAIFMAFIIIVGLYGIKEIIYISVGAVSFLLFYHAVIAGSMDFSGMEETIKGILVVGTVYFVEYVVYYLIKKQDESRTRMLRSIEELREAEKSKDDFMANVSHEIRTPINTICGMSEVVLREKIPYKIREDVFNIQSAGRNLMSVVSDILDFSELQSGKMEIVEETYNITSTINDIINMTMARKNQKNIELIVDCDAGIPSGLVGDEQKIRRVIMNLVNNAIKFTSDGYVSIIISCRRETYGINLSVTVKDTGIGMKEESIEKLFTGFNQVDTKRNRRKGGIGLGLAISQAIIQKMGGYIMVKSKFGKGSMISFVIPQKVADETPIVRLNNKEEINAAVYINMEQFEMIAIRDEYSSNIKHIVQQLDAKCHICKNLAELKRRNEREKFGYIFISLVEYQEDMEYFDELSKNTKIIIIIDRVEEKYVLNPLIIRIYKPFYVLPIVMMFNENKVPGIVRENTFIAPDVHVLVVDDNAMNIKVMEGLLQNYQIKVSKAASGQEALEKVESKDYDFIFMDHMMPEMDGIETLHRIRAKSGNYFKNVPIIALTANAIAGTREMFMEEGFAEFVAKPVEPSVLERVLLRNIPENKIISVKNADSKDKTELKQEKPDDKEDKLVIGDLDVEKGILYCGGREQYIDIIKVYVKNGNDDIERIEKLYETRNWKDYVIAVHAVKSSMLSIGANNLSELAKKLEMAGKNGDEAYIFENHLDMVKEYKRVYNEMKDAIAMQTDEEALNKDEEEEAEVIEDAEFEQMIIKLEDAMYEFNGNKMLDIVNVLLSKTFHGVCLKDRLSMIIQKIQMSDYMSAVESIKRLKNELKEKNTRE